jgi:hypothetical protein
VTGVPLTPIERKVKLFTQSALVRDVNSRLQDPEKRCTEITLIAVQALAFNGDPARDDYTTNHGLGQGPLNGLQGLDIYGGGVDPIPMHVEGLTRILALCGGVTGIQLPGWQAIFS